MKTIFWISLLSTITLISGCSVKPLHTEYNDTDSTVLESDSIETQAIVKTKLVPIRINVNTSNMEVLCHDRDGNYSVYRQSFNNDSSFWLIPLEEAPSFVYHDLDSNSVKVQTTNYKNVSGYFTGSYHVEQLDPTKSTLVFIEKESNAHLDLLEIEHKNYEWISDVFLDKEFRNVQYTLSTDTSMHIYIHSLVNSELVSCTNKDVFEIPINDTSNIIVPNVFFDDVSKFNVSKRKVELSIYRSKKDSLLYDKVIANGIVMDPETKTYKFGFDLGIIGNKIVCVSDQTLTAEKTIDATGLIVSPGFIDMLGFNLTNTVAKYKITDGVTTNLSLHGCTENFKGFFKQYHKYKPQINYGGAIFAFRLRMEQGLGFKGKASAKDIEYMAQRVEEEIEAGGVALAFSPEYYPGTSSDEIKGMMAIAAKYDIPTHFHARYSSISGDKSGIDGVIEVIEYAKELNARVHFMHLHSTGGTGMMDEALTLINHARDEGYKITYDIYPYDSWASNIDWSRFNPGWQKRYGISFEDLQIAGQTERLTEKSFKKYRKAGGLCIAYAMDEEEMIQALSASYSMVGSDGNIQYENKSNNHFRGAGTFSRILGKYVREEDKFSLMDGVSKMTINSIKHLEDISVDMASRGRLQEGFIADITIFDYRTVIDKSTPEKPATQSEGIEYVIVNGHIGVSQGKFIKSVRAGQAIKNKYTKSFAKLI